MARQIVVGQHPNGPQGLFIAKQGIDAHTADPNAIDPWIFSSQWSRVGSILASGQCSLNQVVAYPATGFRPMVWFCRFSGSTLYPDEITAYSITTPGGLVVNYTNTRNKVVHGNNSFQIVKMETADPSTQNFTYYFIVFNLPA